MSKPKRKIINQTVILMGAVSMFADFAGEMLYPIVPIYFKEIGFSILLIGLLEGVADFVSGILKGYFGSLSDYLGKRLPFVKWGYGLSALSKPLMAMFTFPIWIFFVRSFDRCGKGMRSGARDALLSASATRATKAKVFAFHRGLDTLGAVFGPLVALLFLHYYAGEYVKLFYLAFFPGYLSFLFLFFIEEPQVEKKEIARPKFFSFLSYWKKATPEYKKLVRGLLLFGLFNSSDIFLILIINKLTNNMTITVGVYVLYNLVHVLASYPLGSLADKIGIKRVLVTGLFFYAIVYAGFAVGNQLWHYAVLFVLYGLYAAATEGLSKAWVSNVCEKDETATAIGFYTAFQSIAAMLASTIAGLLWTYVSPAAALGTSAVAAIFAGVYLMTIKQKKIATNELETDGENESASYDEQMLKRA